MDQGTTGSTVLVVTHDGRVQGRATREFPQYFPRPGWVEHNPDEIWASMMDALQEALRTAGVSTTDCRAIGITNQRETTLVWNRNTGKAFHPAIVWQDRRTTERCAELKSQGHEAKFRGRTGLVLDPYFSGTKLEWLLKHVDGLAIEGEQGRALFGTIDSFLLFRLTGGATHATDATNASRTLLYNIHEAQWDSDLLRLLNVPASMLPSVRGCSETFGVTQGVPHLPDGIPISGMAGDQQAALFGQTCFEQGDVKCTYGTGAFLLMNTGAKAVESKHGLLTTIAWQLGGEVTYALEGSAFIAGAAVQWLRDGLGIIRDASEIEALAARAPSSSEVTFVPALTGLGAPYWEPEARGLLCGLTRDTTSAHLARAVLEGIAFQVADLVFAMSKDASRPLGHIRVDGGAAKNNLLLQFQADILNTKVDRADAVESTALGAAYLAGLAVGLFANMKNLSQLHSIDRSFAPTMNESERSGHLRRWKHAVTRTRRQLAVQVEA